MVISDKVKRAGGALLLGLNLALAPIPLFADGMEPNTKLEQVVSDNFIENLSRRDAYI